MTRSDIKRELYRLTDELDELLTSQELTAHEQELLEQATRLLRDASAWTRYSRRTANEEQQRPQEELPWN